MIPSGVLVLAVVLLAATVVGIAVVGWVCVGPKRLGMVRDRPEWFTRRVRAAGPYIAALAFVLAVNKGLQGRIERFSHAYGYEATATLYAIEGDLVVLFQSLLPTPATMYFTAVYVVGYAVLLVAPVLVYLFAEQARPMKRLAAAYAINYAVAVVCYAAVVAYGPRNVNRAGGGTSADAPLLEYVPDITYITVHINTNTNVFPSLHAALSVTVLLVAATTRLEFERWFVVATVLASSVVVSTMALGIHWVTDVIAGIVLAVGAVAISGRVVAE